MSSLLNEFKNAGLVTKSPVSERVIQQPPSGALPAVDPSRPQTDMNISGQSNADDPMATNSNPQASGELPEASKSQSQRLVQSIVSASQMFEGLLDMVCDGNSGFDLSDVAPERLATLQMMQGNIKHFSETVLAWDSQPKVALTPSEQAAQDQAAPSDPNAVPADPSAPDASAAPLSDEEKLAAEKDKTEIPSDAPGEVPPPDASKAPEAPAPEVPAEEPAEAPSDKEETPAAPEDELGAGLTPEEKKAIEDEIAAEEAAKKAGK